MHFRAATVEDVETLFAIRCSVRENFMSQEEMAALGITPASVREMIAGGNYSIPLALVQGEAVGFAMAHISTGHVFALFVRPSHEKKGIGSKLLDIVEEAMFYHGVPKAHLETEADENQRAIGFYRHHGWRDTGLTEDGQVQFCKELMINT